MDFDENICNNLTITDCLKNPSKLILAVKNLQQMIKCNINYNGYIGSCIIEDKLYISFNGDKLNDYNLYLLNNENRVINIDSSVEYFEDSNITLFTIFFTNDNDFKYWLVTKNKYTLFKIVYNFMVDINTISYGDLNHGI